jgi:hypothetical protein
VRREIEVRGYDLHDHQRAVGIVAEFESGEAEELLGQLGLVDREADPTALLGYVEIARDCHRCSLSM